MENILITHSEKRLEHVASLLTQTENTDFDGDALLYKGTGRARAQERDAREKGAESGKTGKYDIR